MVDFVTDEVLDVALDTISVTQASLHTGDPGPLGLDNELTTVGYARQPVSFNIAALGQRQLNANASFTVVAGVTLTDVSYWNGTTFIMTSDITDVAIGGAGEIILNAVTTFIGF